MKAPTLTQLCGTTPEAFEEHLRRPAPDSGTYTVEESNALYEEGQLPGAKGNPYDGAPISATALAREAEETVPYHLRPGAPQRRVVCAANRVAHIPEAMVCAPRHLDPTMHAQIRAFKAAGIGTRADWMAAEQGFCDQWGQFLTREEALDVAKAAGQIRRLVGGGDKRLYSEMLY